MFDIASKHPPTDTVKRDLNAETGLSSGHRANVIATKGNAMPNVNHELLSTLAERWNAHDLDHVYGLLAENYREYLNGVLVKQGRSATRTADQFLYDTVSDYGREVDDLYADENGGAMRWRFCGTGPNGSFELSVASFYLIKDGEISECWLYGDPTAYARALGLDG
jgi:ketosteroid isomerase-like protein